MLRFLNASREVWIERLGLLAWAGGIVLLVLFGSAISAPLQVLIAGVLIAVVAVSFRRGWLRLFGPVFFYDAIRLARQRRQLWLRAGYAGVLGLLLAWIYGIWYYEVVIEAGERVSLGAMARMASTYFEVFIVVQAIVIVILTPAYVAGAIAEEKERKTLEFLLATDLRNREIVFGKLASRIGTLGMLILAGLPVLSLIQFFGGVDPEQLLAAFAATITGMLSLSAVSIFASVVAKRARDAIALAYLMPFAYFAASLLAQALRALPDMQVPYTVAGYTFTGMDFVYALTCGNPLVGFIELEQGQRFGTTGSTNNVLLFELLGHFVLFHAILIVLCVGFAAWRVRAIALRQSYGGVPRVRVREAKRRPRVGDDPMIWKEVFVEGGLRMSLVGKIMLIIIVLLSFVPVAVMAWNRFIDDAAFRNNPGFTSWRAEPWWSHGRWERFGDDIQGWVRVAGTVVSCLLLLAITVRGAGSVRGERDRQTFDSLLTTPLSTRSILWGKWLGCMLGVRAGWAWLGVLWLIGLAGGGIHFFALPLLAGAMAVFASAFAWIGIWFSLVCRTTLRATLSAIIAALIGLGGYLMVIGLCCLTPLQMVARTGRGLDDIFEFFVGLSPGAIMSWLPFRTFSEREFEFFRRGHPFAVYVFFGMILWTSCSLILSSRAVRRFREQTNRVLDRPKRFGETVDP